jgi:hypothetical protein
MIGLGDDIEEPHLREQVDGYNGRLSAKGMVGGDFERLDRFCPG